MTQVFVSFQDEEQAAEGGGGEQGASSQRQLAEGLRQAVVAEIKNQQRLGGSLSS